MRNKNSGEPRGVTVTPAFTQASHSASPLRRNSHWPSVRAPVRLILIESGYRSKEQTFIDIVAACGVCPKSGSAFRKVRIMNETASALKV